MVRIMFFSCPENILTQQSNFAYHISRVSNISTSLSGDSRGDDSVDTRELFARLIECEAGGEGENGMKARCDSYYESCNMCRMANLQE